MFPRYASLVSLALACALQGHAFAAAPAAPAAEAPPAAEAAPADSQAAPSASPAALPALSLTINGTQNSASFLLSVKDFQSNLPISLTATTGFTVAPATLSPNATNAKVTVTLTSWAKETPGKVFIRSGDFRSYVSLKGIGTALPTKDLSRSPLYTGGKDARFVKTRSEGFTPGANGYTLEFKVNTSTDEQEFCPYAVSDKGIGFKAYISSDSVGLFSAANKKSFPNPATSVESGLRKFYNNDGRSHTYRFAVTPDNHIFIYRDGFLIDTVRAGDYGPQEDFASGNGDTADNLLKNPNFEGACDRGSEEVARAIEGWDIGSFDIYNARAYIVNQEIDNQQDFNNQVLKVIRYKWNAGWGAAEISQIVDVVPNETYTLSALVKGGLKKEGPALGKIKLQEVQNKERGESADIVSDAWETYTLKHTASADCKQIRIFFYLERDKWGATISPLLVDNVKFTGKARTYTAKAGFNNQSAAVDYFTYDLSGAYAPPQPVMTLVPAGE